MQLKFDANQPYQLDAIHAVTDLFDGQPRIETELRFNQDSGRAGISFAAVPNRLDLSPADLLENLQIVQERNRITADPLLEVLEADPEILLGFGNGDQDLFASKFYNFSVEMETGTGKTYVYLRTVLELFQRYGLRKFIVVTPSIAIRQGVLKTLQITRDHFQRAYGNLPYRYYVYDSANLSQIRQFALSDGVEIMIMTLAAFNKAGNVIHQTTDRLQGETPIRLVQATRPILILDEPQNMESEKSIAALAALHPLFALRYSATHRNPYNVVYRLTPFEAYRQGLVKHIEVASVVKEGDQATPYICLEEIATQKKTITARVKVFKRMASGTIKEIRLILRPGDSLEEKTGRREYEGFDIEEINPGYGFVRFANNREIQIGQEIGADKEAIFEAQIRYTVEEHMRKQERLRALGIKVLSLFFIDRVDNYAGKDGQENGLIRQLFDRAFEELKVRFPGWRVRSAEEVQAAYFAQRRTRSGEIVLEDSATGEAEKDREAYELIMNAKEQLLSMDEPVSFIFSHSALREGWDNPNVFQICTLNQSVSDIKKRQEVGRGVRLAVNQEGEREHDERLNVLTVVANESYEKFVAGLQSEIALEYQAEIEKRYKKSIADLTETERAAIAEEYGEGILPPKPADAGKRGKAHLRKEYILRPEFKELWERIKHKTRYAVTVDSQQLIQDVVRDLAEVQVQPPRVTISKISLAVREENVFYGLQMSTAKSVKSLAGRYPLPNLVELMADLMQHNTPPVRLTRKTLLDIVRNLQKDAQQALLENPHEFAAEAVRVIKNRLANQLIEGIQYEKINEWYEMTQFDGEVESWQSYLEPAQKALYDQVEYDSGVERQFVQELEGMNEVKLYVKLPRWFTVPTPIGDYNPDWAIVWQPHDEYGEPTGEPLLYLVAETKSTEERDKLRPDEARKIECGKRHFRQALQVDYKVLVSASELDR